MKSNIIFLIKKRFHMFRNEFLKIDIIKHIHESYNKTRRSQYHLRTIKRRLLLRKYDNLNI